MKIDISELLVPLLTWFLFPANRQRNEYTRDESELRNYFPIHCMQSYQMNLPGAHTEHIICHSNR